MRRLITLLCFAAALPSWGQQAAGDAVVARYREFRAAVDRNDLAAAELAATAALEASEAVNGASTAVLALNLASVRLSLPDPARALDPAARAHALATSGAAGVDPLLATLTLGRAELAADREDGVERLTKAIETAEASRAFRSDTYLAAVALGEWTSTQRDFERARAAWVSAERLAAGGADDPEFARGRARLGEGVAIFLGGVNRLRVASTRLDPKVRASPDAEAADAAFTDAQRFLSRYAFPTDAPAVLTVGQRMYAQSLAWQGALRAKIESQDERLRNDDGFAGNPPRAPGAPPPCAYRTEADLPAYPAQALNALGVGAVVLHTLHAADGSVIRREVAAGVPTGPFVEAIQRGLTDWTSVRNPESPANCDPSGSRYFMVRFVID